MARLSAKNQVTIPVKVLEEAGLSAGDRLAVTTSGPGRVEIERVEDFASRYAGSIPYPPGYLDELRDEWER